MPGGLQYLDHLSVGPGQYIHSAVRAYIAVGVGKQPALGVRLINSCSLDNLTAVELAYGGKLVDGCQVLQQLVKGPTIGKGNLVADNLPTDKTIQQCFCTVTGLNGVLSGLNMALASKAAIKAHQPGVIENSLAVEPSIDLI